MLPTAENPVRILATSLALTLALFVTACPGASSELTYEADDEADGGAAGSGNAPGTAECTVDDECAAVGATCCSCPTYATRADDPAAASCGEVECPGQQCANTRAVCSSGVCVLACEAKACSNSCPDGYARDASGCLTCECAAPAGDAQCAGDSACVQIAADCCGCDQGGADIAVPLGSEDEYRDMLGCSSESVCPGVSTCVAGDAPRCIQGSCALVGPLPEGACGRPDLAACAACMVNADEQASSHGVGVCQSP